MVNWSRKNPLQKRKLWKYECLESCPLARTIFSNNYIHRTLLQKRSHDKRVPRNFRSIHLLFTAGSDFGTNSPEKPSKSSKNVEKSLITGLPVLLRLFGRPGGPGMACDLVLGWSRPVLPPECHEKSRFQKICVTWRKFASFLCQIWVIFHVFHIIVRKTGAERLRSTQRNQTCREEHS